MIEDAIYTAFQKKKERGWDKWPKMFWLIDLHDVIIPGTYSRNNEGREFYPMAKEVLQWLTNRTDMCIILWTSSHDDAIEDICNWLFANDINFDYVNENPEISSNDLLNTNSKMYFDILLDDKAGFVGETDWMEIKHALIAHGEWMKKTSHEDVLSD